MRLLDLFSFRKVEESQRSSRQRQAVLALGGGGARGLAHLGVMQAIGEAGVQTERIVGVSMGSLVGAMCAVEPDALQVQAKAIELLRSPIFQLKQGVLFGAELPTAAEESSGSYFAWYGRIKKYLATHRKLSRAVSSPSLMSEEPLREAIECLLPDADLRDLPTPLSIVAVDLLSGQRVVLESGSLREAVRASTAIPGFFPPVPWNDMLLCDIGVVDSLPTHIAKSYASDLTIGVDVGQEHTRIGECNTALDALMRMQDIGEILLRRNVLDAVDLVIRPQVGHVAWFDFSEPERLIEEGRKAAHRALAAWSNDQYAA
ncbi:MAG: patatin-like phospholipase family protein [Pirellulales bacterium]|nr:patatin-like phospholipase family protein [Pirellulales bacterium]